MSDDLERRIATLLKEATPAMLPVTLVDVARKHRARRRGYATAPILAAAAVIAVAVAALSLGTARHDSAQPPGAASGPTAAQNKADAQAEADQLVAMASLPPGAVRVRVQPVGLSGPAQGTPGTSQLIDSVTYYSVSMSLSQARAWFQENPQHGFTQSGTASTSGPAGPSYGFQYDLSTSPHWSWGSANLQIGLASQGSAATAIRVDGVAQWIDPSPMRDTSPGPAIRVTISGGCPTTDRGWNDISNPEAPDLDHQLLPAAAPTAALKCTYNGMNGKPFTLASSQQLNATQASAVAAQIRALPLGSRGNGPHSCPTDDARASILAFSYPNRADVDIWEHTSGCTSTDNGHIVSSAF